MTTLRKTAYYPGTHVCALYERPQEQLSAAIEHIRAGLENDERCLFICGEIPIPEFRNALAHAGIDVEREEQRGALVLRDRSSYLPSGVFDPDAMIAMLHRAVQDALAAGFTALRSAGDMSWLLDRAPGTGRLAEYEAKLNEFYRTHKAHLLCFYNRKSLPIEFVDHSLATHARVLLPWAILIENPYYEAETFANGRVAADPEIVAEKLDILDATRAAMLS